MSMVVPIAAYYGINAQDITSWDILHDTFIKSIQNPYVIGCALLAAWSAIYDPTSNGLSDCKSVMDLDSVR